MGGRTSKSEDRPGPPPKPEIGFDDFELLRAIGRGSFGKVSSAFSRIRLGARKKAPNLNLRIFCRSNAESVWKTEVANLLVFDIVVDFLHE